MALGTAERSWSASRQRNRHELKKRKCYDMKMRTRHLKDRWKRHEKDGRRMSNKRRHLKFPKEPSGSQSWAPC